MGGWGREGVLRSIAAPLENGEVNEVPSQERGVIRKRKQPLVQFLLAEHLARAEDFAGNDPEQFLTLVYVGRVSIDSPVGHESIYPRGTSRSVTVENTFEGIILES